MQYVERSLAKMDSLWHKIGIDQQTLSEHNDTVRKHIEMLMDDMVAEVMARQEKIIGKIESFQASVSKITKELGYSSSLTAEVCLCYCKHTCNLCKKLNISLKFFLKHAREFRFCFIVTLLVR